MERRRRPRRAPTDMVTARADVIINHGATFLVASFDGGIDGDGAGGMGLYTDDTRFLSGYELRVNDRRLRCLAATRLTHRHARWTLTAAELPSLEGERTGRRVAVTLDRVMSQRRMHEDIEVRCFGGDSPISLLLSLTLTSDFADIFEVRTERWQRRSDVSTVWQGPATLDTRYRREDFTRRSLLRIRPSSGMATYANGALRFAVDLAAGDSWKVCLQHDLLSSSHARPALAPCPLEARQDDRGVRLHRHWHRSVARVEAADPRLVQAFDQAVDDFGALRLYDHDLSRDVWLPAAGIPWYVAVFGRDSILASLQALPVYPLFAIGTLEKLAQWQSEVDDPTRDAEPGKICHEMRVGEWATFRTIPHTPYYGTADATPLYLLLLGETHRWLGDASLLEPFKDTAERCLRWIDEHGDQDGDGFQEYAPRSPRGYRNQCWRDAEDGVLDERGGFPTHPIATCEMQGYVYAAWLAVAELFAAWGDHARAEALCRQAAELRRRFASAFWLDDERGLAFALDGGKRPLATVTSNPGHCLWTGILDARRATRVAERLLQPDLFTGFGLRTLSSEHPAYDPHSYQRGSVWPHDTMLAAAGLRRYGRDADAWRLVEGTLAAAGALPNAQLPELFAGLQRSQTDIPVPYEHANVPQAWAAGAVFCAVRLLLGLEPDAARHRLYLDPALPPWCPRLALENVRVGHHRVAVAARRRQGGQVEVIVEPADGGLEVVRGRPPWFADPPA